MVELSTLISWLQADVPARDGIPSAAQYEHCVRDAVADYSQRNPLERIMTLQITSGTATYNLPADFLYLIRLESISSPDGTLVTDAGLIPMTGLSEEEYIITGKTITFNPTPIYTASRKLWYAAGHMLDANGQYPDLTDEDASVLMLLAQSRALMLQANAAAQQAWQYAIGDERVDKEQLAEALRAQAERLEKQYRAAVEKLVGGRAWGLRAYR